MNKIIKDQVRQLKLSATLAINEESNKLKKSGIAGLLSAALELTREGLINIMQKKDFDTLLIKEKK